MLANQSQDMARVAGWLVQCTSVMGVAQRTGSTVYHVELKRVNPARRIPVVAQMPRDVKCRRRVGSDGDRTRIAARLRDRRAHHRSVQCTAFTPSPKRRQWAMAMGDERGKGRPDHRGDAATRASLHRVRHGDRHRVIGQRCQRGHVRHARSGALTFGRERYEETIRRSGLAVASNLAGFAEGFAVAQSGRRNGAASSSAPRFHAGDGRFRTLNVSGVATIGVSASATRRRCRAGPSRRRGCRRRAEAAG